MWGVERKVLVDMGLVAAILLFGGVIALAAVENLGQAAEDLRRTQSAQTELSSLLNRLGSAQAGQRDFLLTGDATRLDACQDELFGVEESLAALREVGPPAGMDKDLATLEPLVLRQIEYYKRTFEARRKRGLAAAAALLRSDGTSRLLERVQQQTQSILDRQTLALGERFSRLDARLRLMRALVLLCGLVAAGLSAWTYRLVHGEMSQRRESTRLLEQSLTELRHLGGLVEALQASQTVDEVCRTAGPLLKAMFPDLGVSLALYHGNRLSPCYSDRSPGPEPDFDAADCWALRRGQPHLGEPEMGMQCPHLGAAGPGRGLCVPLAAQGSNLGLLSLDAAPGARLDEARQKLAVVGAEQISLALANLALRERLKEQSVLDPLTGLFNRRYMEESFERERERHAERGRVFSLLMADIDHFKQFNDRHGHKAGDHVLRAIADALRRSVRPRDIVCRYGGEEIVLLLPDADLEQALRCAEHCRRAVEDLRLMHEGRGLGPVTLSLGVASFPADGDSIEALLHRADTCLYEAKHAGRNRVCHEAAPADGDGDGAAQAG